MAARAHAAASLCPDKTVFSCFSSCKSQCFCTSSSRLSVFEHVYSRTFLLDIGRNKLFKLNSVDAEVLNDLSLLRRPTQSPTPTPAPRPQWKRLKRCERKQKRAHTNPLSCSPVLEFMVIKEYTAILLCAVYISPSSNGNNRSEALNELYQHISEQQTAHPDAFLIVAGDFNHADLKSAFPKIQQHIDFPTRGNNTLDFVYTTQRGAYKAFPLPHLGASDHITVMLMPAYRPLVKVTKPVRKQIQALQDCFDTTDWNMFKQAATYNNTTDLQEYAETVTAYINKCTEDVTVTKTITDRANQQTMDDRGDEASLKTARANLSHGIREAKRQYSRGISHRFKDSRDTRSLWRGIQTITDYKPPPQTCDSTISLLNDLNTFFARFEVQNTTTAQKTPPPPGDQVMTLSPESVRRSLSRVNARKAPGPDNIPGRVLRDCAVELTDVFTDIFNISLNQAPPPSFRSQKIMHRIKTVLPPSLDPFQFAYRPNRSTEDAISTALHSALTHLDKKDSYV
ncbi:hypothetical protein M9458_051292 [Cirrhinus mrigala]|uniref:Endonuclease/exonuclease/phosphatase domain-containing protein n=1 Tax=Cirrhinus mrigala TaxID=683832 RepID=A0ABD0MVW1_CIRMR